jgi:hypothetical protein
VRAVINPDKLQHLHAADLRLRSVREDQWDEPTTRTE